MKKFLMLALAIITIGVVSACSFENSSGSNNSSIEESSSQESSNENSSSSSEVWTEFY